MFYSDKKMNEFFLNHPRSMRYIKNIFHEEGAAIPHVDSEANLVSLCVEFQTKTSPLWNYFQSRTVSNALEKKSLYT